MHWNAIWSSRIARNYLIFPFCYCSSDCSWFFHRPEAVEFLRMAKIEGGGLPQPSSERRRNSTSVRPQAWPQSRQMEMTAIWYLFVAVFWNEQLWVIVSRCDLLLRVIDMFSTSLRRIVNVVIGETKEGDKQDARLRPDSIGQLIRSYPAARQMARARSASAPLTGKVRPGGTNDAVVIIRIILAFIMIVWPIDWPIKIWKINDFTTD